VVQLESDWWSVCAVTEDQRIVCSGESPQRTGCVHRCARLVEELRKLRVRRVALGGDRRCAQTFDDEVLCWRVHDFGDMTTDATEIPQRVPGLPRVATLAGGAGQACAIAHDGQVYCWGSLSAEKLIDPTPALLVSRAEKIEGLPPLCELAGGGRHMCGVATDGSVYCWGANPSGQLGDGTREDHLRRGVQVLPAGSVVLDAP
jgi:alpha-tubulin suppressor-like RCC1 family protein